VPCYDKLGHPHKMDRLGFDLEDGTGRLNGPAVDEANEQKVSGLSAQEARRRSIQTCLQSLVHACHCRDANCRLMTCQKMKRLIQHSNACRRKNTGGCPVCKQLIALCCYHAKTCDIPKCPVPYCCAIKEKLERQRAEQRLKQAQLMRRRMALMQRDMAVEASAPAEMMPLTSHHAVSDKNAAQFVAMGHTVPVVSSHSLRSVQSPVSASSYHRTVQLPFGVAVCESAYERHQQCVVRDTSSNSPVTLNRLAAGSKPLEMMTSCAEFTSGICQERNEAVMLQKHTPVMSSVRVPSSATLYGPRLSQYVRIHIQLSISLQNIHYESQKNKTLIFTRAMLC